MSRKGKRYVSDSEDDVPPVELPVKGAKKGKKKKSSAEDEFDAMDSHMSKDTGSNKKAKGKRGKGRRGDDTDEEDIPPVQNEKPKRKKKGRRGDDSDSEDDTPPVPETPSQQSGSKKTKKGGKGKKRRGDVSDDESDLEEASVAASTQASTVGSKAKAKGKKRRGRRGMDSDDDDDDFVDILGMPPAGRGRMYALSSDDEAPVQKTKKKKKNTRFADDSSEEEVEDMTPEEEEQEPELDEGEESDVEPEPEPESEPEPEPEPESEPEVDIASDSEDEDALREKKKKKKKSKKSADLSEDDDYDVAVVKKKKKKKKALVDDESDAEAPAVEDDEDDEKERRKREKKEKKEKKKDRKKKDDSEEGPTEMFFGEAEMGVNVGGGDSGVDPDTYTGFDANGNPIGLDGEEVTRLVARALVKRIKGERLSNNDRRALASYDEERVSNSEVKAGGALYREGDEYGISNFSLSQAGRAQGADDDNAFEHSKDIVIESFSINADKKELFTNASLRIMHGRRYGLLGPNGQGKTTLLKHIASRQLHIPSRIDILYVEQEVAADDTPAIQAVLRADKKRAVLMVDEERIIAALDKDDKLMEQGVTKGRLTDAERDAMENRLNEVYEQLSSMKAESSESHARRILSGLGFTPDMQEMPTRHFSGGWRMRISLARALFMKPDLLLLDEPTNHLDLNAVIWLEDYLSKWKSTLLVVSHDQDFLSGVVTDIVHLEDRKLWYYKGDYDDFKTMHAQKLIKQAADYEKQQKMLRNMKQSGKSKKQAEEVAKTRAKRDSAKGGRKGGKDKGGDQEDTNPKELIARPRQYTVSFKFTDPPELPPPILSVSNVSFRYTPKHPYLFKDISFGIDQSSRIAIVGPNGAGKSTLLNLCIGVLQPTSGEIERNRFLKVGKYSQHFLDVLPMDKSPVEFLNSQFSDLGYQDARALLGRFGLEGHAHVIPCRDLSGGQKARVVFASLALESPHIMVLDEPTNNLDIESIDALADALNAYAGGVVLVSHDSRLIRSVNCTLWVCDKQAVQPFNGDIDDYRDTFLKELEEEETKMSDLLLRAQREAEEKKMAELRARRARLLELRKQATAAAK